MDLIETKVYVVTEDNLDEFLNEFKEIHGDVAFVALSMRDYENLALNIADIRRYLQQQGEIILYYEEMVKKEPELNNNETTKE